MPSAAMTRTWNRPHGSRSSRAGIRVETTPLASASREEFAPRPVKETAPAIALSPLAGRGPRRRDLRHGHFPAPIRRDGLARCRRAVTGAARTRASTRATQDGSLREKRRLASKALCNYSNEYGYLIEPLSVIDRARLLLNRPFRF